MRVAVDGLGVDHQPRLTVGGQHVLVVQVAVDDPAIGGRFCGQVGADRQRLLDQAVRDGRVARQGCQLGVPPLDV
jgi:hypothetical protein